MFKKQKILLVSGCSYSDNLFLSTDDKIPDDMRGNWDMWPNYLADELDLLLLNTSKSGCSNQTIFYKVMENLVKHKSRIDTVAIMFTSFERFNFNRVFELSPISESITHLDKLKGNRNIYDFDSWQSKLGVKELSINFMKSETFEHCKYPNASIENNLNYMYMIANYCENHNIKFIFSQAIIPFNVEGMNQVLSEVGHNKDNYIEKDYKMIADIFLNNIWFNCLEKYKNNIVGWPFLPELNGFYMDYLRFKGKEPFYPREDLWCVSKYDVHPNKEAQKIMGDIMIKKYREIYG